MASKTERLAAMELRPRRPDARAPRGTRHIGLAPAGTRLDWLRIGAWTTAVAVSLAVWAGLAVALLSALG